MKRSEKNLLDSLRDRRNQSEEPLKNVKNALGSIGQAVGNPLTKNELSLNIDVFFCNPAVPGVFMPPAAVPAVNQTPLPVYFFGLSDMYGAYQKSRFLLPLNLNWGLVGNGFIGYNFQGLALPAIFVLNVQDGDYILEFSPQIGGANLRAMIRIRCENIAYASLVHSLMVDVIKLNTIRFNIGVASILQFTHPLVIAYLSTFGKLAIDNIDPRLYVLPTSPQQTISDIPVKMSVDKNIIIGTQIDFTCQHFNWILFVEKIEILSKNVR